MEKHFDFEETRVVKEIKERKAKKVLLQLPEGIKQNATYLANYFQKETSAEIIVSGESCWGGCDLALEEAKIINADLIVHYGHAPFFKNNFPTLYIEMKDNTPIQNLLNKSKTQLKEYKKLGIAASVQHLQQLEQAKQFFNSLSKEVLIPARKGCMLHDGQVIGCEYNALKSIQDSVDAFLIIGNQFHSLGAALALSKPVYLLDVYNNEIVSMDKLKNKIIKQRFAAIEKVKEASKIGIILGLKPGQQFGNFRTLKEKFEKQGKEVIVITMREMTPEKLINFYDIKAFVELACPRIAVEDYEKYERTIITFREAQVALNEITWEEFLAKGLL